MGVKGDFFIMWFSLGYLRFLSNDFILIFNTHREREREEEREREREEERGRDRQTDREGEREHLFFLGEEMMEF